MSMLPHVTEYEYAPEDAPAERLFKAGLSRVALYYWGTGPLFDISKSLFDGRYLKPLDPHVVRVSIVVYGICGVLTLLVVRHHQRPVNAAQRLAIVVGLSGVLQWFLGVTGIITVAWHGLMGAFAGITVVVLATLSEFRAAFNTVGEDRFRLAQLRADTASVFQFLSRGLFAFVTLTGVALTILLQDQSGQNLFNIDQLAAGMQILCGFFICVFGLYSYGLGPTVRLMADIWKYQQQWFPPPRTAAKPVDEQAKP